MTGLSALAKCGSVRAMLYRGLCAPELSALLPSECAGYAPSVNLSGSLQYGHV